MKETKCTIRILFSILCIAFMSLIALTANALPRYQKWKQIETEHFIIIYPEQLRDAAQQIAGMAESVHQDMNRFFHLYEEENGEERTRVLLTDHRDSFDRFNLEADRKSAGALITLHVGDSTAGTPSFNLRTKDWLIVQFVYQYTNIIRKSMNSMFRFVFGTAFPDSGFSGWMDGGMALYMLTYLQGISERNPYLDMFLRTDVLEASIVDLKQRATAGYDVWPGDIGMYLYGYSFLRYLADTYGADRLSTFHQAQSRTIPHPFEKDVFEEVYGKSFETLQEEWKQQTLALYRTQIQQIQSRPLTVSQAVTDSGYFTGSPLLSPDGAFLYYIEDSPHDNRALVRLRLADNQKERLTEGNFSGSFSVSTDGQRLYFSKSELYKTYYDLSDLYSLDLRSNKVTRLTKGARAFDPAISPDGQTLVYVTSQNGNTHLQSLNLSSGQTMSLLSLSDHAQIRQPAFSDDGSMLAVQVLNGDEQQDIYLMNRDGSQAWTITDDEFVNASPCWALNDRFLLFSSDRGGVPNIFAYALQDSELYQVTNVLTGAFDPAVSPDGRSLIFKRYSSAGMDIHQTRLFAQEWAAVSVNKLQPVTWNTTERFSTTKIETSDETSYRALSTLMPSPFPQFGSDEDGMQLGLNLSGGDPLELHAYSLSLLYGLSSNRLEIDGEYVNTQFFPTIRLYGFDRSDPYKELFRDTNGETTDYWERRQGGGIEIGLPLYRSHRTDFYLTGGYEFQKLTSLMKDGELQAPLPDEGDLANVSTRVILKSFDRHRYSISPESGVLSSLRYRRYDETVGSDYNIDEVSGDLNLYLNVPFLQHHVLALRGAGGVSQGDTLKQGVFQVGGYLFDFETDLVYEPKFFLRGYKKNAFSGDRFVLGTVEYRFPIWHAQRSTLNGALFWDNLAGKLFFEAGHAWEDATEEMDLKYSAGGELALNIAYLYGRMPLGLNVGMAQGFDDDLGETQMYFRFKLNI